MTATLAAIITVKTLRDRAHSQPAQSSLAQPQPTNSLDITFSTKKPLFFDATMESGIDFVHVLGERRALQLPEQIGSGGAFFDYDNDGDLDLYLIQSGHLSREDPSIHNQLFRNQGDGKFVDVSKGSGADIGGYGMGCAAADFDSDGDVDLLVTRLGSCAVLSNQGNATFQDVTASCGIQMDGFPTSAAFLDYDRDGLLDCYVTRYVDWSAAKGDTCYAPSGAKDYCGPASYHAPSTDKLYHNLGQGRFEDVSTKTGIDTVKGNGLGVLATDFNGDDWVDIYVANDQTPAFLWVNQHDGTFRDKATLSGAAFSADGLAIAGMGTASEDLDDDGDYDLVVTNIRNQPHLCLRNDGGSFQDVSHALGFASWSHPFTGFGITLFDQDHDGRLDGFVANGAVNMWGSPYRKGNPYAEPNQFVRRNEKGRFYDASAEAGPSVSFADVSRATIAGDYDNDGDVDLVITNNGGPVQLLRNENRSGGSWSMLDMIPAGGCRNAINARVEWLANGKTFRREVRPHVGFLSSHDPRVHAGLGIAKSIDQLKVQWPKGERETWTNLSINKLLTIKQGTGSVDSTAKSATP
ncbi:MAG: CRTAC1 family protein [Planctomycetota bacterium]